MKRLISIIIIASVMLIGITTTTYAFDWKSLNVEVISQTTNDSQTILTLKDKQERTFKVIYQDEAMLKKLSNPIIKYKDDFYAWRSIHFKDISFMVFANFLDVVIIPQQLLHKNLNLAMAIPGGITMVYDPEKDTIHYDFRIMKEDQFIRIDGDYLKEDELVTKIGAAYDNPATYLNPTGPVPVPQENIGPDMGKILQSLIYLYNEDWNGRQKTIPIETIQKVIELRQNNPGMTKAQLWKMIKKEKIQITKRELDLILILYFNEFK
jgi:hypothetical protein